MTAVTTVTAVDLDNMRKQLDVMATTLDALDVPESKITANEQVLIDQIGILRDMMRALMNIHINFQFTLTDMISVLAENVDPKSPQYVVYITALNQILQPTVEPSVTEVAVTDIADVVAVATEAAPAEKV